MGGSKKRGEGRAEKSSLPGKDKGDIIAGCVLILKSFA
jgi:hypothetical protein